MVSYEDIARMAQQGGTIYFTLLFAVAAVWAFLPRNKKKFEQAARMPLEDGDQ